MGVEDVKQDGALVHILNVLNLLSNVLRGRTNTSDRQEDIVLQEIPGEHLDIAGEGGGEHERLAVLDAWHILALNDPANLGLETHVQHAISLVEDQVLDVAKGDSATLDQVDETTGGGNEKIAAALNLAELGANIGTTVDDTWSNPGSVGKLARLVVDLRDKLTGGGKDQGGRVGLPLASEASSSSCGWCRWASQEGLGQDGEQEATSLSRTSLGTSHQVTATHNDGDRVFLNWGGNLVVGELNVLQ